jgi:hypothetical protein
MTKRVRIPNQGRIPPNVTRARHEYVKEELERLREAQEWMANKLYVVAPWYLRVVMRIFGKNHKFSHRIIDWTELKVKTSKRKRGPGLTADTVYEIWCMHTMKAAWSLHERRELDWEEWHR